MRSLEALYSERFGRPDGPLLSAYTPYRVCPLGAHVDHQHGFVSGFAIDCGVELAYRPCADGQVRLVSANFPGEAVFSAIAPWEKRRGDWGDYVRGSAWALSQFHPLKAGLQGVVRGSLPIGGLSSSAAVILCCLQALAGVNGLVLTERQLIDIAHRAENEYVGLSVGKLDQSTEVLARRDQLLFLDTQDQRYERIVPGPEMQPFEIGVFFSGITRALTGTGYNNRVDESRAAAWYLKGLAGMPLGSFQDCRLRQVPEELFEHYQDRLPQPFRRRALHFYGECRRTRQGAEAWRQGDLAGFGKLMAASCDSSIYNYEAGSRELIALQQALLAAPGVYGARFSGAGFKGCCVALMDPARREQAAEAVARAYLAQFPELRGAYSVHFSATGDGVGVGL